MRRSRCGKLRGVSDIQIKSARANCGSGDAEPGPVPSLRLRRVLGARIGRAAATRAGREPRPTRIAMHGAPALPADFSHMPYANPDAPKGGRLVQGFLGTFDSLNPLIVQGLAVQQIRGYVHRKPDGARL